MDDAFEDEAEPTITIGEYIDEIEAAERVRTCRAFFGVFFLGWCGLKNYDILGVSWFILSLIALLI